MRLCFEKKWGGLGMTAQVSGGETMEKGAAIIHDIVSGNEKLFSRLLRISLSRSADISASDQRVLKIPPIEGI